MPNNSSILAMLDISTNSDKCGNCKYLFKRSGKCMLTVDKIDDSTRIFKELEKDKDGNFLRNDLCVSSESLLNKIKENIQKDKEKNNKKYCFLCGSEILPSQSVLCSKLGNGTIYCPECSKIYDKK